MTKPTLFAVVDIETTGGLAKRDKIIEIAILITDGNKIIKEYHSLINPQRSIPYEITRITGITDDMVYDAPKFYEVAKDIVLLTQDAVFVAHHVSFDYSFIQHEFERLGYTYSRKQLCTVRLSRKTLVGLKSYSLGSLIKYFELEVNARHRAYDDAFATTKIFMYLMQKQSDEKSILIKGIRETKLPENVSLDRINQLPDTIGVYYFYDKDGKILYVGKSKNIRHRILQHFSKITSKSEKLSRLTMDIDFVETGSELISLLLESEEIKKMKPPINKAQRNLDYPYYIYHDKDSLGYIIFGIKKFSDKSTLNESILCYQSSLKSAKSVLSQVREIFQLCESKLKIRGEDERKCIYYDLDACNGACRNFESSQDYNERAIVAQDYLCKVFDKDYLIVGKGRSDEEVSIIYIKDKQYYGFGYLPSSDISLGFEEMIEAVNSRFSSPESSSIILSYLSKNSDFRLISV